ncbi:hypothetical protein P4N68_03600 [Corynebacterium felinum]|uniref:GTPase-associated protein 1 N-terminal domain-containing protein n=1 Tax=Corynebacterium felinum TaxID=131318 RepID=A0ABU2B5N6_9CORY|nr:hypothetical protein [Corynebacterium felinum]MDF5820168.1 hypothetical protein [Corynebacterium felinum]MDR7353920.1 hypothetical protein [Corynebacterium felinum]WJY96093.1 hypothetical protein CFELI_12565 [Corynebacterium felinum]
MNTHHTVGVFSFASFSPSPQRAGGWSVGDVKGVISADDANSLRRLIPTSLNDGETPGNYPSREEIAQLNRRFAWLPILDHSGQVSQWWAFYASAHAGQDSTGRPGNVFSFVQVCPNGTKDIDPVGMLYSPEIPVPFGKSQVDKVQLPDRTSTPGPVTNAVVDAFIHGWEGDSPLPENFAQVTPVNPGPQRSQILSTLVGLVQSGSLVVLACPLKESALWVTAVGRAVGKNFSFSTFETPDRLMEMFDHFCQFAVVKTTDAEAAKQRVGTRAVVVSVDEPLPFSPEAEPMSFVLPEPPEPVHLPQQTPPLAVELGTVAETAHPPHPHAQSPSYTNPVAPVHTNPVAPTDVFHTPPQAAQTQQPPQAQQSQPLQVPVEQQAAPPVHSAPETVYTPHCEPEVAYTPHFVPQAPMESLGIPVDMAGENPFTLPPVGATPELQQPSNGQTDPLLGDEAASIRDAAYSGEMQPGMRYESVLELSAEDLQLIGQNVETLKHIFSQDTHKSLDSWRMLARLNQLAACPPHTPELVEFRARMLLTVADMNDTAFVTALPELGILTAIQRGAVLDAFVEQAQTFLDPVASEWEGFYDYAESNLRALHTQSPQLVPLVRDGIERLRATQHSFFARRAQTTTSEPGEAWRIKERWADTASQPQIIEGKR